VSPRIYPSARARILDAAERLLLRDGLLGLSVDAVLGEAELSKGGFFHHFKSKEELLTALVERLIADVGGRIQAVAAGDKQAVGRTLRAHVTMTLEMPAAERRRLQALVIAVVAASLESPTLAAKLRAANRDGLAAAVAEGVGLGPALVVQLALDGYFLNDSAGTMALDGEQKAAFRDALLALLQPRRKARSS
jgi:AcrR family transcriptional regulator